MCKCTKRRTRVRNYSDAAKVRPARLIRPAHTQILPECIVVLVSKCGRQRARMRRCSDGASVRRLASPNVSCFSRIVALATTLTHEPSSGRRHP